MELKDFIYHFNLSTTLTITDTKELCYVVNNKTGKEVDKSNSISFYHLVESFNKLNNLFLKDYEQLTKLDIGKKIELIRYSSFDDYRILTVYIEEPKKEIVDDCDTIMYICQKDGKPYTIVTNNINPFDDDYYRKEISLKDEQIKEYLDFGEKYQTFFESYHKLKNEFIYGNGTTVLFSRVIGNFPNFNKFELVFGNAFFNGEDYIKVNFELGEELKINYQESEVKLFSIDIDKNNEKQKREVINTLLNELYVNKEKLKVKRK